MSILKYLITEVGFPEARAHDFLEELKARAKRGPEENDHFILMDNLLPVTQDNLAEVKRWREEGNTSI